MAGTELEKRKASTVAPANQVSPADEPSAEWGWHGGFPVGTTVGGIITGLAMFAMLIGNHHGRTEDIWLVGVGLLVLAGVGWKIHRARTSWRR